MHSFLLTFNDASLEKAFHREQFTVAAFYRDILFLVIAVLSHAAYITRSAHQEGIQIKLETWKPLFDGSYTSVLHIYMCGSILLLDLMVRILIGYDKMIPHRTKFAIVSRFVITTSIFACVPEHMYSAHWLSSESPTRSVIISFVILGGLTHLLLLTGVRLYFRDHLWTAFISSLVFAAGVPPVRCQPLANTQTEESLQAILHQFNSVMDLVMFATFGTSLKTAAIVSPCVLMGWVIHFCFLFAMSSFGVWVSERSMRLAFLMRQGEKAVKQELQSSVADVSAASTLALVGHTMNMIIGIAIVWTVLLLLVHSGIPLGLNRPVLQYS